MYALPQLCYFKQYKVSEFQQQHKPSCTTAQTFSPEKRSTLMTTLYSHIMPTGFITPEKYTCTYIHTLCQLVSTSLESTHALIFTDYASWIHHQRKVRMHLKCTLAGPPKAFKIIPSTQNTCHGNHINKICLFWMSYVSFLLEYYGHTYIHSK